jgi:predicted enzyme related to lactoylglutathione lyase
MAGQPAFFEIGVPDAKRARAFYAQVFDWTWHPMDGDQAWIETPTAKGGLHDDDQDRRIVTYFAVDDIKGAAERVRELGGQASAPTDEGLFGWFSQCTDDQGVTFGLHQAATRER